jgi:CheY-like chemotaxis protein
MNFQGKILLVDDEAHIRKYVSLLLRSLGNPVIIEADNGEAALALYDQENPDLVLLDVNMPRLDGLQTLMVLRARDPDSVVVMLTSLINRHTVEECQRLGAVGYLRKDTSRLEIIAQLKQLVADSFTEESSLNPPGPA